MILLAGCTSQIGESPQGTEDRRPIEFREPPKSKEGSGTAPGCEGVAARGECRGGTLVFCDLKVGKAKKVDCKATGDTCIENASRGAACSSVAEKDPNPKAAESPCTGSNVSEAGFCTSAGVATYCDTKGDKPKVVEWKCADDNKTCTPAGTAGSCNDGTYCCGTAAEEASASIDECGSLDFAGVCDGSTAKWCNAGKVKTRDCAGLGQRCQEDGACGAEGAWCCGESDAPDTGCDGLGFAGECTGDASLKYCYEGEVETMTCGAGKTCQVGGTGATCVTTSSTTDEPTAECQQLGFDGICTDSKTIRYCPGTKDSEIKDLTCTGTATCKVGSEAGCAPGANCCEPKSSAEQCEAVNNADGTCDGNMLKYCTQGVYKERDCGEKTCMSYSCTGGTEEWAECCE